MTIVDGREALIDLELLRGSVESRCRQASIAFVAMILNAVFATLLLGRGIGAREVGLWLGASTVLLLVRYLVALRARGTLAGDRAALARWDRVFRLLSIVSQAVTGAGIWIAYATGDVTASYILTLLICLYAAGVMINLAHDYRSARLTLPLLMGQPVLFWLLNGVEGIAVGVILAGLTLMAISSVRNTQRIFDASIRIRFEKDEVVGELERERKIALDALAQAEAANRSKSFFMAAASHDLRQPLYAANLLNYALSMHPLSAATMSLVDQQGKALAAASGLFDNLLDLARFESGAVKPAFGNVDLGELLTQMDAEFRPQCEAKGLALVLERAPCVVRSDYDLLARLLRNLLSNAVRYTDCGRVRLAVERDGPQALLRVEDTGPGIAAADQAQVFEAFRQLEGPRSATDRGVGLGLAIVRHIAGLLETTVTLDSMPGRGTTLRIALPLAAAETDALPTSDLGRTRLDLAGLKVWIVDDDVLVRGALQAYFEQQDCRHWSATSRADLERLQRQHGWPDVAILDDMLGGPDTGLDLAHWIAGHVPAEHLLLTTGHVDPVRWRELTDSGFRVLRKPVAASALSAWLAEQAALHRERTRRPAAAGATAARGRAHGE